MKNTFKKTLLASLIVPFALVAQSASAGTLVTDWGYSVTNTFVNASLSNDVALPNGSSLSWGVPFTSGGSQSSISITNATGSDLVTNSTTPNSGYVNGGIFTHNNNEIDVNSPALKKFTVTSSLTLTPGAPTSVVGGPAKTLPTVPFASFFRETPNRAANCPDEATPCKDIFTIADPSLLGDDFELEQSFVYDGFNYNVFLRLLNVGTLTDAQCTLAAGVPASGCAGFLTEEGGDNSYTSEFRITASEVPDPGTLALLGLGLAGLGLSRRKKAAKA